MSSANRTDISYLPETTYGTTPATGNYSLIPFTAAPDFSYTPSTVQSQTIRSDRQIDDLIFVGSETGGSVEFEFSYGRYNDLLEGAFWHDFNKLDIVEGDKVSAITTGGLTFGNASNIPASFKPSVLVNLVDAGADTGLHTISTVSGAVVNLTKPTATAEAKGTYFSAQAVGVEVTRAGFAESTSAKTITITGANFKTALANFTVDKGDWICVSPLGFYRVTNYNTGGANVVITYDQKIVKTTGYTRDPTANSYHIFFSENIMNGTTKKGYSILERFNSVAGNNQILFSGCVVDTLELTLDTQAVVTGSFTFAGLDSKYLTTLVANNRIVERGPENVLNSSSNVGDIYLGTNKVEGPNFISSMSLSLANSVRRQNAVGSISAVGIEAGSCDITGTLNTYFGNTDLARNVINNTESSFVAIIEDKNTTLTTDFVGGNKNRSILVDLPRIKFSSGAPGIEGINTDITVELGFQAIRNADLNYQIKLASFPFL